MICPMEYFFIPLAVDQSGILLESAEKDASHSAVSFVCGRISCVGVRVVVFTGTPCVETKNAETYAVEAA